jgi:HEAT repeat protein
MGGLRPAWAHREGLLARIVGELRARELARRAVGMMDRGADASSLVDLALDLGELGGPEAALALRRLLDVGPWPVRLAAVYALASAGGPEATAALRKAASRDPSIRVRRAAAARLARPEQADVY